MKKVKTIKINSIFICIVVLIFLCLIIRLIYVGTGGITVGTQSLNDFASARHTVKRVVSARRGTIFSSSGEVLAKDVNSYTVIAYLSPSRTKDMNNPHHVVDKQMTAEALSPLINMKVETILKILNTKIESCDENDNCEKVSPYQVELGPGGRGITELLKDQIESLDLPGIDFIASTKRYYPNGDFLSYTLGYVKRNEKDNTSFGEMGLELSYNDELTGEDGYIEYQADIQGYQITSSPSNEKKSKSGYDIYLTIDDNIQMFTEQAITTLEGGKPSWAVVTVMNAKTGEILGVSSTPSFNNNTLEIKSYYDPFVSYSYEPGSTMKIFSFLAAMENGIYDGKSTYKSGSIKVDDATIKDWNKYGWGTITYDQGFMGSSNVAATKLALKMGRAKLKDFYTNLGFGTKTGIGLPNETEGIINFRYNTEIASASFGQGITVNASQMLQALTVISNKGMMIKPYLISKIVDPSTGEVIVENKRTEIRKIASEENVNHMISLMRGVVDGSSRMSTGTNYKIKGYDLIGKTGTAEIASSSGGYQKNAYVKSFAGLFPGKDPEVIVYFAAEKLNSSSKMTKAVKDLVKNVGKYLNLYGNTLDNSEETYVIDNYISKNSTDISDLLKANNLNPIVIGDGNKIIDQYPLKGTELNLKNKVFLLTNGNKYIMPNINGWSRSEVDTLCKFMDLDVTFEGYGYVEKYSISKNEEIKEDDILNVTLFDKFKEEVSDENKDKEEKKS